ncbi:MAG: NHL repeat-containing protein [Fimbriimonadaceae bacterium]
MKPLRTAFLASIALAPVAAMADWYVSTSNNFGLSEIRRYDESWNYVGSFGSGGHLWSMAVTPDGTLLVSDYEAGTIRSFDVDGNEGAVFAAGLVFPTGIVFDANGDLLVAEEPTGKIQRYAPDSTYLGVFAQHGMVRQNQLAVDSSGNIYTCSHVDQQILRYAADGTPLGVFADNNTVGLHSPAGLAFDTNGFLYVSETFLHEVKRLDSAGNLVDVFCNTGFIEPEWLTFDGNGNLMVPGYQSGNVRLFDALGNDIGDMFFDTPNPYHAVRGPSTVPAHTVQLVRGRLDAGNVDSLSAVDGDVYRVCRFIVPNTLVAPVSFLVKGASPADAPRMVVVRGYSRMATSGAFREEIEILDTFGNTAHTFLRTVGTTLTAFQHNGSGLMADLTDVSGDVNIRVSVRQTGPSAASAWCHELEQMDFLIVP